MEATPGALKPLAARRRLRQAILSRFTPAGSGEKLPEAASETAEAAKNSL
jgi:hypothetical protein